METQTAGVMLNDKAVRFYRNVIEQDLGPLVNRAVSNIYRQRRKRAAVPYVEVSVTHNLRHAAIVLPEEFDSAVRRLVPSDMCVHFGYNVGPSLIFIRG